MSNNPTINKQHIPDSVPDSETKQNIANALWLKEYDEKQIPKPILEKINSEKNSNASIGQRIAQHYRQLLANPLAYLPSYKDRYQTLLQHTESVSAHQVYARSIMQGMDSVTGYLPIPYNPGISFPAFDTPQWKNQVGWHFFVGNYESEAGRHYSVQMMLWQYAILPPDTAARLGLSDIENQTVEIHLAISDAAAGLHYRAVPTIVAGTTGLIDFTTAPFRYSMGKNCISSQSESETFPVRLQGWGIDRGLTPAAELEIDIYLDNIKGYFLQGDDGCSPSVDGVGTLYYSASNLQISKTHDSTIRINGETIKFKSGKAWYDHQWATGFMPAGAAQHDVMRAAGNLSAPGPGGWDWFMVQFQSNIELTFASIHSNDFRRFYAQTGPTPPGNMQVSVAGKFIDDSGKAVNVGGSMTVTAWVQSKISPDKDVYWPTNTWYPNHYTFVFDAPAPEAIRTFSLTPIVPGGQTGFFASGLQYLEGGAIATDPKGNEIGRGFIEGTAYARNPKNCLRIAGLPESEATLKLLRREPVSVSLWFKSMLCLIFNYAEFKKIMAQARGL
jgi:predicted secreted hydrolase